MGMLDPKLRKIKALKMNLANSPLQSMFMHRRKILDFVDDNLSDDDALEIFEWLFDMGITQDLLFINVFNYCNQDLAVFTRAIELALINLRKMDGVILTVTNAHPLKFMKSMCADAKKVKVIKSQEELTQELLELL